MIRQSLLCPWCSIFWWKDLGKRTVSDKILKDRASEIARNCNYDGCQRALASMVHKFLEKKQDQD